MAKNTIGINKDKERGTYYVQKQYKGKTIKKRGFSTINEAKAFLANQIYLIDHPDDSTIKKDITLNELFKKYLEYRETKARITTIDGEVRRYNNHIAPTLGEFNTADITQDAVHTWRINLVKKQMTDNFTNKIIGTFRHILNYAQSHDYKFNAKCLDELEKAKIKAIPKNQEILTYDEIDLFLNTFEKDVAAEYNYWLYFYAFSRSGMRPNEFRGLQVRDLKDDRISVNHDITSKIKGKGTIIQPCKNDSSNREVLMPIEIMELLKEHVKGYNPSDFVFGKEKPFAETNLRRELNFHLKKANLKHITIYGFRHSHATHLIRNGVMIKVVSARLGHKDIQTTLNTYQHLLKEDQQSVLKFL